MADPATGSVEVQTIAHKARSLIGFLASCVEAGESLNGGDRAHMRSVLHSLACLEGRSDLFPAPVVELDKEQQV